MSTLIDELLACCWPDGVPARLDRLVHRETCAARLADFKLGPVLPFEPGERPIRLIVSAEDEPERWRDEVARNWPSDDLAGFLQRAPAATRWMVDSDGSEQALVFLDDLQNTDHDLGAPQGLTLMCLTLQLPSGEEGYLSRHDNPPLQHVPATIRRRLDALLDGGATGVWGLRWRNDAVASALWISETRWRRNPASARRAVRAIGDHPGYDLALDCLARHERVGYPDVVELFADGTTDVTLGVL